MLNTGAASSTTPSISLRDQFLLDPSVIFLNHGSFGACPKEVLEACQGWQREMERNPVAFLGRRSGELLARARADLAAYLGARAEDLVFIANATHGVNAVAKSLPLAPGDEVLGTGLEYGACDNAWTFACRQRGASYRCFEPGLPFDGASFADRLWEQVTPRTRVLFLSHITSTTALILPVAEVCRRARDRGILTVVDGAHAPGQVPLDLERLGADVYTGNCHKWLCAPKGSAFLHVRAGLHALVDGSVVSWGYSQPYQGHETYAGSTMLERRFQWQGTRDLSAFLSVPAAIAFQARHGWDAIRADCHRRVVTTLHRVCDLTGLEPPAADEDFAQMAILPVPPRNPEELQATLLRDHGIEVPVTVHEGRTFVRISLQAYNAPGDEDALVGALRAIYRL